MKMMSNGYSNSYNSNSNGLMSTATTSSASSLLQPTTTNNQSQGMKTYFKTPEGRYKLRYEKTQPPGLLTASPRKSVSQVTLAQLRDKPSQSWSRKWVSHPLEPPSSLDSALLRKKTTKKKKKTKKTTTNKKNLGQGEPLMAWDWGFFRLHVQLIEGFDGM